jgi:hypothetical protein
MKKRSQIEIVGLLIIVIMISLILLIALVVLNNEPPDYGPSYINKDLSASLIGAILNTNSNCTRDTFVKDLLIDCAKMPENGGTIDFTCYDGRKSCEFAEEIIEYMLVNTLEEWNKLYEFKVISPSNQVIMNFTNAKENERGTRIDTQSQPLPISRTNPQAMVILVCLGGRCEI